MLSLTAERETPLHRWRAGHKLALLGAATLLLFFFPLTVYPAALLLTLAYLGLGLWRQGLRLMRGVFIFAVILVLWQGLWGDLGLGLQIASRLLVLVAAANLVTLTTKLSQMIGAIERVLLFLPVPRKAVKNIALALGLTIRFLPVITERLEVLRLAWSARSTRAGGWRLILPLLISVIDDSDHIGEALRARGGLE